MESNNRLLILALLVLMTYCTPVKMILIREDHSRSSTIRVTKGHVLMRHVIHEQRTYDIMACAHLCLARPNCMSFNYENTQNGICELNGKVFDKDKVVGRNALSVKKGYSFSQLVNLSNPVFSHSGRQTGDFVFTTLGVQGETGPTDTSGYLGTSLEGKVTLDNGIQIWTIPETGVYVIEVSGASGASSKSDSNGSVSWRLGGLGANISGTFKLYQGTQLKILVGQEGLCNVDFTSDAPGGGGGGSFVVLLNNTPLIIAGGGGGGGTASKQFKDGDPGQATENGTRCGGSGGSGGQVCQSDNIDDDLAAGAGAGLKGDGNGGPSRITNIPLSFINGGTGGTCVVSNGGFGGGGFALDLGGGGGGYSGGGVVGNSLSGVAGGGGSYNSGTNQRNMTGVNKGHGKVIIKLKT